MNAPAIVHEFAKNRREVVRTTIQDFHGRRVVDLRVWLPRSSDGVLVPAPKGLTVDQSLLPELERSLRAARHALATTQENPWSLLDFIKDAVPAAAAARSGYLEGQNQQTFRNNALARQARLDQMTDAKNQAEIGELGARADYYGNGGASTRGFIVRNAPGRGLTVFSKATGQPLRQATPDDVQSFGVENDGTDVGTASPLDMMRSSVGLPPKGTTPSNGINVDTSDLPTVGVAVTGAPGPLDTIRSAVGLPPRNVTQSNGIDVDTSSLPTVGLSDTGQPSLGPLDTMRQSVGLPPRASAAQAPTTPASSSPSSPSYIVPGTEPPAKPVKAPTPLHVARAGVVDPGTGNVINYMADGSVQVVRKATPAELTKATHIGGSGSGTGGGYNAADARADRAAQQAVSGAVAATQGDTTAARANLNKSTLNPAVRSSINSNPSLMGQVKAAYNAAQTRANDAHTRFQYSTPGMTAAQDSIDKAWAAENADADAKLKRILSNPAAPDSIKQQAKAAHAQVILNIRNKYSPPPPDKPDDDQDDDTTLNYPMSDDQEDPIGAGSGY